MNDNEKFYDLEGKIRSLPEPDYEKKFTSDTQDIIHENLLQFASSYYKKKKRATIMKKISVGLVSVAALVIFAVLTFPIYKDSSSSLGSTKQGQQSKLPESIPYENTEYGFSFTLPKSWEGYQVVSNTWDGISTNQQQNKKIESGQILLIRHPQWTEEKPRQDIPIMIFTLNQWSSLEKGEFHIGAAPIGPAMLGKNNKYVFALPARYNYALLEGYQEVENILKNNPLHPKNIEKDPSKK